MVKRGIIFLKFPKITGIKFLIIYLFVLYNPVFAQLSLSDTTKVIAFIEKSQDSGSDSLSRLADADSALSLAKLINKDWRIKSAQNKGLIFSMINKDTTSIYLIKQAADYYSKLEKTQLWANACIDLGDAYYYANQSSESIKWRLKALEIQQTLPDTSKLAKQYRNVGVMYWRIAAYEESTAYYKKALELSEAIGDSSSIVVALNSLGAINWGQGMLNIALDYYQKAYKINSFRHNVRYAVLLANNIGLVFYGLEKYEKALQHFLEAEKSALDDSLTDLLSYTYVNIGQIYLRRENYQEALVYFQKSIEYLDPVIHHETMFYRFLGETQFGLHDYKNALKNYQYSLKFGYTYNSWFQIAQTLYSIGQLYAKTNQYEQALNYLDKSLKLSIEHGFNEISKKCYFEYSKLYEKKGSLKLSLDYYKKATQMKDSIFGEKNNKQLAEFQIIYETNKKEIENTRLRNNERLKKIKLKENEKLIKLQTVIILLVLGLFVISITLVVLLLKKRKDLMTSKAKLIEATAFKDKLFAIIGHDLRGPIGTIGAILTAVLDDNVSLNDLKQMLLAGKNSAFAALNILENLLAWAKNEQGLTAYNPSSIKISELINRSLILLTERASRKNVHLKTIIDKDVEVFVDVNMADTTVRNILSNAIKFTPKDGEIILKSSIREKKLNLSITDTGVGMTVEELEKVLSSKHYSTWGTNNEKGSGIGLKLCADFIKLNKGTFSIRSEKGVGTSFSFTMPLADK